MNKLFTKGDRVLFANDPATFDSYNSEKSSYITFHEEARKSLVPTRSLVFDANYMTYEKICKFMSDNNITGASITDLAWTTLSLNTKQLFIQDIHDLIKDDSVGE